MTVVLDADLGSPRSMSPTRRPFGLVEGAAEVLGLADRLGACRAALVAVVVDRERPLRSGTDTPYVPGRPAGGLAAADAFLKAWIP